MPSSERFRAAGTVIDELRGHEAALTAAIERAESSAHEDALLFRAAARTMQHASVLAMSARNLARHIEPAAMYADIVRLAREKLGASGVAIYLADAETERSELALTEGPGSEVATAAAERFWDTAGGRVVRSGVAEFHSSVAAHATEFPFSQLVHAGVASVATLPLLFEGRTRGLLVLGFAAPQAFEPEQRQLLLDFATHVALAVRNALLFADLERRAARLAAVAQVQRAMSAAVALDEVYARIYDAVASVVDAPCFVLLEFDEDSSAFIPEYAVNDRLPIACEGLPRFPLGSGSTTQAFLSGEPNVAGRSSRGWSGHVHEVQGERDIAVVLSAPIIHGDRVLGVLQAQSYRTDAYDWNDVDLVMLIARQAGTAIANARAFEAERQERAQAEAVALIARVALRAATVQDAAADVLDIIDRVLPTRGSALSAVRGSDSGTLHCLAARGSGVPMPGTAHAAEAGDAPCVVPLASGEQIIGALAFTPRGPRFTARELVALRRLADPVALAMSALRLREQEQQQQARQQTLATALEMMEQPVFVLSSDRTIQYANGAAAEEFLLSSNELVGMRIDRLLVHPLSSQQVAEVVAALARDRHWSGELLHRRRDGSEFPAWVSISAIPDTFGDRAGQVATVRNLTEERRVAEQLRQSEKLAALGELVAGVAHEVNNPLTGISAFAQLLLEDQLSAEQAESVSLMKREADRAVSVIRDLLTFSRKTGPRNVLVNLNELVEQTLRLRAYGMRTAGITVDARLAPNLPPVQGDDRQLQQVLLNLVVNAEHAMAATATRRLTIQTRTEGRHVVVEVTDTGVGMSAAVQKRIFEPFFTTKAEGSGTGLGLSVSYGIVQTHGGTLTVRSSSGSGATFRISLPAAPAAAVAKPAARPVPTPSQ